MLDLTLLRILKHKLHYDRIVPNLPAGALDPKTEVVLADFGAYLKETGHPVVKMGAFKTYFFNFKHKGLPADKATYYAKLIDNCEKNVDAATTKLMANKLVELGFATDVGNLASDYHKGDEIDIISAIDYKTEQAKVNIMTGDSESLFVEDTIEDLLDEDENLSGLRFRLACLRDGLRPLRSGDFVLVCGRPDSGKTSFITSELAGMVQALEDDDTVLWFNNESEGNRIIKRAYSSFLRCNVNELLLRKSGGTLLDDYRNAGGNKLRVIDCHGWTTKMVEQVMEDVKPKLVIFDMIDNLEFAGTMKKGQERTDQILEAQYQWARTLGVTYSCPVMATSQISAEVEQQADTQCWPPQHALKDSKTGKQGAVDTIIMIGKSADPMCATQRYISTPKNKLSSKDSNNNYIRQVVDFDGARAVYSDPI